METREQPTSDMLKYLPPERDRLTGLPRPWWQPLHARRPMWWRCRRRAWSFEPTFRPERSARWLVPLPVDAVMFYLDLVDFKIVLDTHGFHIGDAVLVEIGRRLELAARPWPTYRYGGDEFLVIARLSDPQAVESFGEGLSGTIEPMMSFPSITHTAMTRRARVTRRTSRSPSRPGSPMPEP